MIRALYDWTMVQAKHRNATLVLLAVAFLDSSFFPVPPFVLMIPMILAQRERAWRLAAMCTLASVAGALLGYGIGALLFEQVAKPILSMYGQGEDLSAVTDYYREWGVAIVVLGGLAPVPFKIFAIASGAAGMNIGLFLGASLIARATRFFAVAALLYFFGPPVRKFIEQRLPLVAGAAAVVIAVALVAWQLLKS